MIVSKSIEMVSKKKSETETEWLFKDFLQEKAYFDNDEIIVEFKDSTANEKVKNYYEMQVKKTQKMV